MSELAERLATCALLAAGLAVVALVLLGVVP